MFHEIAARLGGEVVVILSGAAPLDSKVLHFLRAAFSTVAMQAYGQVLIIKMIDFKYEMCFFQDRKHCGNLLCRNGRSDCGTCWLSNHASQKFVDFSSFHDFAKLQ